jgi:glycosyltransferase involved in cell wall biosynthesis
MTGKLQKRWRKLKHDPVGYLRDSRHAPLRALGEGLFKRQTERLAAMGATAAARKITVIMTAYNTGALVDRAVRSVLAQSHQNLELMIIDDASTDDTLVRLRALAAADGRVRVFSSPTNHGTYWSKNWCLARATGEFVAFHDSDDFSHPDRLRIQMAALLDRPRAMACTCRWHRVDDDGKTLTIDGRQDRMAAISLMIRREEVIRDAGFFDTVRIAADTEFIQRLRQIYGLSGLRHLRQHLYTGYLREGSLTTGAGSGIAWQKEGASRTRAVHGDRAAYYDAFSGWHARHREDKAALKLSFPSEGARRFEAPAAMLRGCGDTDMTQVREVQAA